MRYVYVIKRSDGLFYRKQARGWVPWAGCTMFGSHQQARGVWYEFLRGTRRLSPRAIGPVDARIVAVEVPFPWVTFLIDRYPST